VPGEALHDGHVGASTGCTHIVSPLGSPFDEGGVLHGRYREGSVQVNTLDPDCVRETAASEGSKPAYAALMVGKEAIAFNDRSREADAHLERLLSFYFRFKGRLSPSAPVAARRDRGRPRRMRLPGNPE